jgi:hypothetical protein
MKWTGRAQVTLLVIALLSNLAIASAPASAHPCVVPGEQRTLEVKVKVLTKHVKREQVAKIEVRTYRPAQEDFLGQEDADMPPGTPMEPVGNARLTVGVLTGNQRVSQTLASITNDNGKRVVKVDLFDYHFPGPAELRIRAQIDHFSEQPQGTCVELQEGGYQEFKNAFTVH